MKLELKHLAPYLPYGLWIKHPLGYHYSGNTLVDVVYLTMNSLSTNHIGFNEVPAFYPIEHFKPILRPLSDITNYIEIDGRSFIPASELFVNEFFDAIQEDSIRDGNHIFNRSPLLWRWVLTSMIIEWHFDVFGLIDAGLAIDINTINEIH